MDAAAFACLPVYLVEDVLLQAFQQLDEQHLRGTLPLVCKAWHQISLRLCTSLVVTLGTPAIVERLPWWLKRNGTNLQHLSITFQSPSLWVETMVYDHIQEWHNTIGTTCQDLRSLQLEKWPVCGEIPFSLSSLTQLTSLQVHDCMNLPQCFFTCFSSSLRSLTIANTDIGWGNLGSNGLGFCHLTQLTNLDLTNAYYPMPPSHVKAVHNLPSLRALSVHIDSLEALEAIAGLPCTSLQVRVEVMHDALRVRSTIAYSK